MGPGLTRRAATRLRSTERPVGADNVKRVHQELGGKSRNIVLDDADLAKAITESVYRLMMNSG